MWGRPGFNETKYPSGNNFVDIVFMPSMDFALRQRALAWVGLKSDGTLVWWGHPDASSKLSELSSINDAVSISASLGHVVILRANGSVVCFGSNAFEQCNAPLLNNVVDVGCNRFASFALKSTGEIAYWGDSRGYVNTVTPANVNNIKKLGSSLDFSISAINDKGKIYTWGSNSTFYPFYNLENNPPLRGEVVDIFAGKLNSAYLLKDGTLYFSNWYSHPIFSEYPTPLSYGVSSLTANFKFKGMRDDKTLFL
jgi:alpha-tubulin suppressor-like RCC1 family protein